MNETSEKQKTEIDKRKDSLAVEILSQSTIAEIQSTDPQLVEKIDKDLKKSITIMCHEERDFSGPIPTPEMLKEYDNVLPGLAGRIVAGAEDERHHRHATQTTLIKNEYLERRIGQIFGFLIGIAGLVVCLILGLNNNNVVAGIVGGASLVGLVSVFIFGKRVEQNDSKENTEADEDKESLDG